MIRLSRLTDYGFVVLSRFVADGGEVVHNARDLAEETALPQPTVSKLLKTLTRGGLLTARRGVKGGYVLARPATAITAVDIITALEGPVALTDCSGHDGEDCSLEHRCPVRTHWMLINDAVNTALDRISLADMTSSPTRAETRLAGPDGAASLQRPSCEGDGCNGTGAAQGTCGCTDFKANTTRGDGQ